MEKSLAWRSLVAASAAICVFAVSAHAQDEKAPTASPSTSKSSAAKQVPKDPNGIAGISPFWESVSQGDAAFLAQDFPGATTHYQDAITHSPKNPVGHLRMAEVSLKENELPRAEEFIAAALRFSEDVRFRAQAHFLLAEVKERQAMHDEAIKAWRDYKVIDGQLPAKTKVATTKGPLPPVVYVETADKRMAAIEAKKKLDQEYAEVRARIQANIDKADEATGGKKADDKKEGTEK